MRTTPAQLYAEAAQRGLRLEPRGDKLAVIPGGRCPPEFASTLRAHKFELLAWLEGRAAGLAEDEIPWLHIGKQILFHEFDGADSSTVESLKAGLRAVPHPLCRQALAKLEGFE
jgi:hypothetical protein